MRKSLVLGAAALLTLTGSVLTPFDAEARPRWGGVYGGGYRAVGFARPAYRYGWRGGYWGGYPRYGYYRRGYGGGAVAAGLVGGAILGAGLAAAATNACDPYYGCGYSYAYPSYYYGYGYPGPRYYGGY